MLRTQIDTDNRCSSVSTPLIPPFLGGKTEEKLLFIVHLWFNFLKIDLTHQNLEQYQSQVSEAVSEANQHQCVFINNCDCDRTPAPQ